MVYLWCVSLHFKVRIEVFCQPLLPKIVTKTCLYNVDPLKPHFYIVKLGFTGIYIIFLISAQNIDCGYSLEPPRRCGSKEYTIYVEAVPRRGGSKEYPQSMFWAEIWKVSEFLSEIFHFLVVKTFSIFEQACFRNVMSVGKRTASCFLSTHSAVKICCQSIDNEPVIYPALALTLKVLSKFRADDIPFFFFFSEKIRRCISCK